MSLQNVTYDVCQRYVLDHKGLVDNSIYLKVTGWLRSRSLKYLSSCPEHFPQALSYVETCFVRQVAAFFKKNTAFCQDDAKLSALSSFHQGERICRITNRRLDHYLASFPDRLDPVLKGDIERTTEIIYDVLGSTGDFYQVLPELVRVTSGASSTRGRRDALPYRKMRIRNVPVTAACFPLYKVLLSEFGFSKVSPYIVDCNRVETVPKNWKTDRTIACEPEGNMPFQLAFDSYVKGRLKRKLGIDLSDQSKNQDLARRGSIDGSFATIDLSMASDTLSYNCVVALFPFNWFKFLNAIRSPFGDLGESKVKYAKFSSMGNGCTFGIETLVFASICKAVGCFDFACYGDDLVIPTSKVDRVVSLLAFLGFSVNTEKSYTKGPFRESCGADWYDGKNVTPAYIRFQVPGKPGLCHLVNSLSNIAHPDGHLWKYLREMVLSNNLPLVPYNLSSISGVWIDVHSAYSRGLIQNRQRFIPSFKAFTPKTKSFRVLNSQTYYLWHLYARDRKLRVWNHITGESRLVNEDFVETSLVSHFTHKYKRKWERWHPPAQVAPAHLYWWTDFLTHVS